MELSQVALMAGEVGCICDLRSQEPRKTRPPVPRAAGASTVIMMRDKTQTEKYERSAR